MPPRLFARTTRLLTCLIVTLSASVTLSLSKGAPQPALAADVTPEPLLVATSTVLVYVDGNSRKLAGAGALARGFRLLSVMADGSVLVSYYDAGAATVEAVSANLSTRAVKKFGVLPVGFIAPANDGFLVSESGLLHRYDARGSHVGTPIAPQGVRDALGFADANVIIASGRLGIYDRGGRLRHELNIDADRLIALPGDRFAVTDVRNSEVRVYTTALELKSTLRFPNRQILALAAGADGTLAVANGHASCNLPDVEVDVFGDINAQPTARMRTDVGTPVAMAVGTEGIYVANSPCRSTDDGTVATFGRDGKPRGVITNIGNPTGILPFTAKR